MPVKKKKETKKEEKETHHSCCARPEPQNRELKRIEKLNSIYIASLSKQDQEALSAYQEGVPSFYKDDGKYKVFLSFNILNNYLRKTGPESQQQIDEQMHEFQRELSPTDQKTLSLNEKTNQFWEWKRKASLHYDMWTADLMRVIQMAPRLKKSITVYRGVDSADYLPQRKEGEIGTLIGFVSTSWDVEIPYQYMGHVPTVPRPEWAALAKKYKVHRVQLREYLERRHLLNKYVKKFGFPMNEPAPNDPWRYMLQIRLPIGFPILMPKFYEAQQEIVLPHHAQIIFHQKTVCQFYHDGYKRDIDVLTLCYHAVLPPFLTE